MPDIILLNVRWYCRHPLSYRNLEEMMTERGGNVDKNGAYPVAIATLESEQTLAVETELRQVKYLNNLVEQDHRNIKRIVKPILGFKSFHSARRTLNGIEAMNMVRKGQVERVARSDVRSQVKFVSQIFGLVA